MCGSELAFLFSMRMPSWGRGGVNWWESALKYQSSAGFAAHFAWAPPPTKYPGHNNSASYEAVLSALER